MGTVRIAAANGLAAALGIGTGSGTGGCSGVNGTIRIAPGRWLSMTCGDPTRPSPISAVRRAVIVAIASGGGSGFTSAVGPSSFRPAVTGQGRLGADGETEHSAPSGKVDDPIITRHRPLIVLAESHSKNITLRDRAEWERNVRRGRSARGSITVQGWRHPGGELWLPNTLVSVTSPMLWLDNAEMLIVGCTYSLDEQGGTLTELAIARPDSFQLLEGVAQSKLFGKLRTKEQREKREKAEDWSTL